MTSHRSQVLGAWARKKEPLSGTHKQIMYQLPTWQRQRRLDSISVLRERFHTVGERREKASATRKSCRVGLATAGLSKHWFPAPSPANSLRFWF